MRIPRRSLLALSLFAAAAAQADTIDVENAVQWTSRALPPGAILSVTYGQGWLSEPLQSEVYKAPPVGAPIGGCFSVVSLELEPPGPALESPVTVTFPCEGAAGRSLPMAYIDNRWTPLPSTEDSRGRVVITTKIPTTYALISLQVS